MTDTLTKLFQDTIKDVYNAEKQFLKAMPKLSKAATSAELKKAIDKHTTETEGHVGRLEEIATQLGIKPAGKVCKAAQGLVEEAEEHLEEVETGPVLDAAIILCAQKNEHYEVCSYGTLCAWATELGLDDIVAILEQTLTEEKAADKTLNDVALEFANAEASSSPGDKISIR